VAQEIEEQRKSEKDIRRFIKSKNEMRRECDGSLLLMTAEYQLLSAVDITVQRTRSKKK